MPIDGPIRQAVLDAVPRLRAFAISLCGNIDRADDLVQETLLRALANIRSFQPSTNMSAWLFTIMRNHFYSEYRKRRREVEDVDGSYTESLKSQPEQLGHVEFGEFRKALVKLPADQREALVLVGAAGFSYEDAANICSCAVGTIKSRVNRAREKLTERGRLKAPRRSARTGPRELCWRAVAIKKIVKTRVAADTIKFVLHEIMAHQDRIHADFQFVCSSDRSSAANL